MKVEGDKTFWGRDLDEGESEEVKKMLGVDMQLHKPGKDAKETERREGALDIIDDPEKGEAQCEADHAEVQRWP